MKKLLLYFAVLCTIPAAINAQVIKTIVGPIQQADLNQKLTPQKNKSGCPTTCPTGMSCDGACCMYPTKETGGAWNYIINGKCNAIKDLHMRFEVTKELTAEYDEETNGCASPQLTKKLSSTEGIVIQFNCVSKDAPSALIQYLFYVTGTDIYPHLQYAGGTPDHVDHDWVKAGGNFYGLKLAKANSLSSGYVLEVELGTDNDGYVNAATFTVTEPDGKKHVQNVTKESLFKMRISEFQTDIVSTNGHYVHYAKGGEGTLSYSAKEGLCVVGGNYYTCDGVSITTCETSNAEYGKLSPCCSKPGESLKQTVTIK